MALAMSRPFKHPRTGIFWLRKRVPGDLRVILGKTEFTKSLGTRDPAEAKQLHAESLAVIEAEWAALRRPPVQGLKEGVIAQLEEGLFEQWLAHHQAGDNQKFWRTDLYERLWQPSVSPFLVIPRFPLQLTVDDCRYGGDVDSLWSMRLFAYQCGDDFALARGGKQNVASRITISIKGNLARLFALTPMMKLASSFRTLATRWIQFDVGCHSLLPIPAPGWPKSANCEPKMCAKLMACPAWCFCRRSGFAKKCKYPQPFTGAILQKLRHSAVQRLAKRVKQNQLVLGRLIAKVSPAAVLVEQREPK